MADQIMPCFFDLNGKPREAGSIVGRLLVGYGELEGGLIECIMRIPSQTRYSAIGLVFGLRGAEKRLKRAKKEMRDPYTAAGLGTEFAQVLSDLDWCRETRNQYAHCNWSNWNPIKGFTFIDYEHVARLTGRIRRGDVASQSVSPSLLKEQEAYFLYVQRCLRRLAHAYHCSVQQVPNRGRPWPAKMARPLKCNPRPRAR
jgi:hypothetical protein